MKFDLKKQYKKVQVICESCKHEMEIFSTYSEQILRIESCANCHPAYNLESNKTAEVKRGRADSFSKKYNDLSLDSLYE